MNSPLQLFDLGELSAGCARPDPAAATTHAGGLSSAARFDYSAHPGFLWSIGMTGNTGPVPSREELAARHHAYIDDLDAKGLLVGAGPFLDDTGNRFGTGMIIIRTATRGEAETIANQEPYILHGVRRLKLVPWQRIAGQ
jgi:uncharacterized protein